MVTALRGMLGEENPHNDVEWIYSLGQTSLPPRELMQQAMQRAIFANLRPAVGDLAARLVADTSTTLAFAGAQATLASAHSGAKILYSAMDLQIQYRYSSCPLLPRIAFKPSTGINRRSGGIGDSADPPGADDTGDEPSELSRTQSFSSVSSWDYKVCLMD